MGKVIVANVLLKNAFDETKQVSLEMIADTGAVKVGLPQSIIQQLDLIADGMVYVKLADGTLREVPLYQGLKVCIDDRYCITSCLGKPEGSPSLLGQIVFEEINYIVDCSYGKIRPNPDAPHGQRLFDDF